MLLTRVDGTPEALFSHLYPSPLPPPEEVRPLVLESKDWHSDDLLVIPVAFYPMIFNPTKKSGAGKVEPKSVCGFRAEVSFKWPKGPTLLRTTG